MVSDRYAEMRGIATRYKRMLLIIALLALIIAAIYIAYGIKRSAAMEDEPGHCRW